MQEICIYYNLQFSPFVFNLHNLKRFAFASPPALILIFCGDDLIPRLFLCWLAIFAYSLHYVLLALVLPLLTFVFAPFATVQILVLIAAVWLDSSAALRFNNFFFEIDERTRLEIYFQAIERFQKEHSGASEFDIEFCTVKLESEIRERKIRIANLFKSKQRNKPLVLVTYFTPIPEIGVRPRELIVYNFKNLEKLNFQKSVEDITFDFWCTQCAVTNFRYARGN